jgi:hypothetical protein
MSPALSTAITALFLVSGAVAVWSMMVLLGRSERSQRIPYRTIHSASGWICTLLFLLMFVTMFGRLEDFWEESPPRVAIHFALAIGCLFLLVLKVGVARYCKGLGKNLFALGAGIYLFALPMAILTGSYYLLRVLEGAPYISHANLPEFNDEVLGKAFLINKCTNCHLLTSILHPRTAKQWEVVVTRMVALARPQIRPAEARQILNFLVKNYGRRDVVPGGTTPFDRHCAPCHEMKDLAGKRFDRKEWEDVIRRMHEHDPETVPLEKTQEIVDYLLNLQPAGNAGK